MKTLKHMPLRHMPPTSPLVAGLMLIFTCVALCEEKKQISDEQRAEQLEARIEMAIDAWSSVPKDKRPTYDATVRQVLDSLTEDEICLVAQYVHSFDIEEEAFRRWARFEPGEALKAVRAVEDANAAEIKLAGTGLEGGPGEAMSGWVFGMYLGALDGWSEVAPKAAWESFKKREGPLSKSLVVEDYSCNFYEMLFEHLARTDPDFAFKEFMVADLGDYEELAGVGILKGYLRSAPRGRDWKKVLDQSLSRGLPRGWRFYSVIRTDLMGRWLEDDSDAAEKWFRQGEVEGLNWSFTEPATADVDPFAPQSAPVVPEPLQLKRKRHHLWSAAGYWAGRDFVPAWQWMKSSGGFQDEGFHLAVLDGMSAFFDEESWGDQAKARSYCLKQLAKLPDQADRDQFVLQFANVLWVFDDTQFLGQPPPNRAKWLDGVRGRISTLGLSIAATQKAIKTLQESPNSESGPGE